MQYLAAAVFTQTAMKTDLSSVHVTHSSAVLPSKVDFPTSAGRNQNTFTRQGGDTIVSDTSKIPTSTTTMGSGFDIENPLTGLFITLLLIFTVAIVIMIILIVAACRRRARKNRYVKNVYTVEPGPLLTPLKNEDTFLLRIDTLIYYVPNTQIYPMQK